MTSRRLPPGMYGPGRDGLGDPRRPSQDARLFHSPARIEHDRIAREHPSAVVRAIYRIALRIPTPRRRG
ncbi:hypothetical protein H1Q78_17980 [Cellulosimicrobium cellulans]|uniref:hypothetical protein n=1 Tax=Cellulosimicrobium cellulans TaxID=1710 RepID=UPI001EDBF241|nr:hypothetical protein [Cellulosimicrobium cellulans]UKJ63504.1 hypothetical protein H1Q78_17980 [Cellulosimicrobium cellulans]